MPRPSRRMQKCIHIDLLSIKYHSTCGTLNMPLEFAWDNCKSKIEAKSGISKKAVRLQNKYMTSNMIGGGSNNCGRVNTETRHKLGQQWESICECKTI